MHALLGFLLCPATHVLAHVCDIDELCTEVFYRAPPLLEYGRSIRVLNLLVDASSNLGEGALYKLALLIASSQEDGIDGNQNP